MELLGQLGLKDGTFNGRVAVVTGAARGIGEAVEAFEVQFDIDTASTAGLSVDAQLAALQGQLAQIDLEQLGKEEKQQLLTAMSKLLKG